MQKPTPLEWVLDINVLNHAANISGVNGWAITLLDVLTGLEKIKICVGYRYQGNIVNDIPASLEDYEQYEPVYETLDGWNEDISHVKSFSELPINAQKYLRKIEELTHVNIAMFSVGPDREQTVIISDPFEDK